MKGSVQYVMPDNWNGILVVGERPTEKDFPSLKPFSGGSGMEVLKQFAKAGVSFKDCAKAYAHTEYHDISQFKKMLDSTKTKLKNGDAEEWAGKYTAPEMVSNFLRLREWIRTIKPKMIVLMGEAPLRAVLEETGADGFHGSMEEFEGIPVVPTYSPQRLFTTPEVRFLMGQDLRRAFGYLETGWPKYEWNIQIDLSFDDLMEKLEWLKTQPRIAVDIEVRKKFYIGVIGFAWSEHDAVVVPIINPDFNPVWTEEQEIALVLKIKELLEMPDIQFVGQNYHFDAQHLARHWGVRSHIWMDTMVAHHSIFSDQIPKALNHLASIYLDYYKYWKDEGKLAEEKDEAWEPSWDRWTTHLEYNGKDCCYTFGVATVLSENALEAFDAVRANEFQHTVWPHLLKLMLRGNRYDWEARKAMRSALEPRMRALEEFMEAYVPEDVFPRGATPYYQSPKQLCELFYHVLNIAPEMKRNAQRDWVVTTEDAALKVLMIREPIIKPLCEAILTHRSMRVFYNTFLTPYPDFDDYCRSGYQLAGPSTYRLASRADCFGFGLNLQNLPKGNEK